MSYSYSFKKISKYRKQEGMRRSWRLKLLLDNLSYHMELVSLQKIGERKFYAAAMSVELHAPLASSWSQLRDLSEDFNA